MSANFLKLKIKTQIQNTCFLLSSLLIGLAILTDIILLCRLYCGVRYSRLDQFIPFFLYQLRFEEKMKFLENLNRLREVISNNH